jgi:RHS repeat-associated protein
VIRHDYLPFGEEIQVNTGIRTTTNGYVGDGIRQKFTGKDRDSETGLDYFEARYYAGKQGRFTSPDEFSGGPDDLFDFVDVASENPTLYGDLTEPQSLNKYVYLSYDTYAYNSYRQWQSETRTFTALTGKTTYTLSYTDNLADQLKSVHYAIASVGTLMPDSQSPAKQMRETKKAELFRVRPFLLGETTQPVLPPFPSN